MTRSKSPFRSFRFKKKSAPDTGSEHGLEDDDNMRAIGKIIGNHGDGDGDGDGQEVWDITYIIYFFFILISYFLQFNICSYSFCACHVVESVQSNYKSLIVSFFQNIRMVSLRECWSGNTSGRALPRRRPTGNRIFRCLRREL